MKTSKTEKDKNEFYALNMPIIIYDHDWVNVIPQGLIERIKQQRLVTSSKPEFLQETQDIECLPYLMTASFHFPLNNEWTAIYMHCTRQYLFIEQAENNGIPAYIKNLKLSISQVRRLTNLKKWIRSKQVNYMEGMEKQVTRYEDEDLQTNQSSLFQLT